PDKVFNLNKVFIPQRLRDDRERYSDFEQIDFDEKAWREEQLAKQALKNEQYESCLLFLLESAKANNTISLQTIKQHIDIKPDDLDRLIPSISVFKEIMVDLIKTAHFDIQHLREERAATLGVKEDRDNDPLHASHLIITDLLLAIVDTNPHWHNLLHFFIKRSVDAESVLFESVPDYENGVERLRTIYVSNIEFRLVLA
ncbi:MAG: hypothetical protein J5803_03470, partial [Desulfovibrio sp.]|nr:hypothetical protein [Desulfovibrio sp.]